MTNEITSPMNMAIKSGLLAFLTLVALETFATELPEEIERLKVFVGDWDVVERVWEEPGAEPKVIHQTSRARMIMDGRFLEIRDQAANGSYEFIGWHGYHTAKKKYINVAISNRRTDINPGECVFDEQDRYQCRISGLNEPVKGDPTQEIRGVGVFERPDKYIWRNIRTLPNGTQFVLREVIYTRKKSQTE